MRKDILPADLPTYVEKENPVLLDVRTEIEFQSGHLPGAVLIPVDQLFGRLDEIEKWRSTPIVVYCAHGVRSLAACEILQRSGFNQVTNLRGGLAMVGADVVQKLPKK